MHRRGGYSFYDRDRPARRSRSRSRSRERHSRRDDRYHYPHESTSRRSRSRSAERRRQDRRSDHQGCQEKSDVAAADRAVAAPRQEPKVEPSWFCTTEHCPARENPPVIWECRACSSPRLIAGALFLPSAHLQAALAAGTLAAWPETVLLPAYAYQSSCERVAGSGFGVRRKPTNCLLVRWPGNRSSSPPLVDELTRVFSAFGPVEQVYAIPVAMTVADADAELQLAESGKPPPFRGSVAAIVVYPATEVAVHALRQCMDFPDPKDGPKLLEAGIGALLWPPKILLQQGGEASSSSSADSSCSSSVGAGASLSSSASARPLRLEVTFAQPDAVARSSYYHEGLRQSTFASAAAARASAEALRVFGRLPLPYETHGGYYMGSDGAGGQRLLLHEPSRGFYYDTATRLYTDATSSRVKKRVPEPEREQEREKERRGSSSRDIGRDRDSSRGSRDASAAAGPLSQADVRQHLMYDLAAGVFRVVEVPLAAVHQASAAMSGDAFLPLPAGAVADVHSGVASAAATKEAGVGCGSSASAATSTAAAAAALLVSGGLDLDPFAPSAALSLGGKLGGASSASGSGDASFSASSSSGTGRPALGSGAGTGSGTASGGGMSAAASSMMAKWRQARIDREAAAAATTGTGASAPAAAVPTSAPARAAAASAASAVPVAAPANAVVAAPVAAATTAPLVASGAATAAPTSSASAEPQLQVASALPDSLRAAAPAASAASAVTPSAAAVGTTAPPTLSGAPSAAARQSQGQASVSVTVICRLCRRGFPSQAALEKHEAKSDLHRGNLAAFARGEIDADGKPVRSAAAGSGAGATAGTGATAMPVAAAAAGAVAPVASAAGGLGAMATAAGGLGAMATAAGGLGAMATAAGTGGAGTETAVAGAGASAASGYRDRAAERRKQFGIEAFPPAVTAADALADAAGSSASARVPTAAETLAAAAAKPLDLSESSGPGGRLMARMGFTPGAGLGRHADGATKPVDASQGMRVDGDRRGLGC